MCNKTLWLLKFRSTLKANTPTTCTFIDSFMKTHARMDRQYFGIMPFSFYHSFSPFTFSPTSIIFLSGTRTHRFSQTRIITHTQSLLPIYAWTFSFTHPLSRSSPFSSQTINSFTFNLSLTHIHSLSLSHIDIHAYSLFHSSTFLSLSHKVRFKISFSHPFFYIQI